MLTDLFLAQLKQWAAEDPEITALLVVGSYAGEQTKRIPIWILSF